MTKPYKIMRLKSYRYCNVESELNSVTWAAMLSASPSMGSPFMPPSVPESTKSRGDFQTRMAMVPDSIEGTGKARKKEV